MRLLFTDEVFEVMQLNGLGLSDNERQSIAIFLNARWSVVCQGFLCYQPLTLSIFIF